MAHHQHHGLEFEAQMSRSLQIRPTSAHDTSMPAISEDELVAEADEPPDSKHTFHKNNLTPGARRQSLLTKALHTDYESHDEHYGPQAAYFTKVPSASSTCSTQSVRSVGDFTSDDGHVSPSTRASTPGSPRSIMAMPKLSSAARDRLPPPTSSVDSHPESDASQISYVSEDTSQEATVEAKLGRKRCIMFACGQKDGKAEQKPATRPTEESKPAEQKRPCSIKFACPFKPSTTGEGGKLEPPSRTIGRHLSPAPIFKASASPKPAGLRRRTHRDSDTTIKNVSPTTPRAVYEQPPSKQSRRLSSSSDLRHMEACRFHEFASEEEEHEDWTQESTCHRSRLTVNDTLKKEMDIRKLGEEAAEEEALDEELDMEYEHGVVSDDDLSDDGFDSDDEEGFAESDDDDTDDSDYEWWVNRSRAASPYIRSDVFGPTTTRTYSDSSIESDDDRMAVNRRFRGNRNRRLAPVPIRPGTPELPDSTDFVCGTLDEDRPLEQAYLSCMEQRKAAKHRAVPQDIDPSFPVSDPEMGSDDDEEDDAKPVRGRSEAAKESTHSLHDQQDQSSDDEEPRGRRMKSPAPTTLKRSPRESPKRLRSPPPKKIIMNHSPPPKKSILINRSPPPQKKKSCASHRSPAPRALFLNRSPRRMRSPPLINRLTSPPPSRRGSMTSHPSANIAVPFLGIRNNNLTHTASLPRSPGFLRMRKPSARSIVRASGSDEENEDEDGSETDKPSDHVSHPIYTRGAIDIAQGLERKRLKRRELFQKQYQRKEGRKERSGKAKRPQPGKGAERMRQVGLDCAVYRGTRMLSV